MKYKAEVLQGPEGQPVVVVLPDVQGADEETEDYEDCGGCIICCNVFGGVFVLAGLILVLASISMMTGDGIPTLGIVALSQMGVGGFFMLLSVPMCWRDHKKHEAKINRYMHVDDPA